MGGCTKNSIKPPNSKLAAFQGDLMMALVIVVMGLTSSHETSVLLSHHKI